MREEVELQRELATTHAELRRTQAELHRAEHRLEVERWRTEARETRRYRRAVAVLEEATGLAGWLQAPLLFLRELFRTVPAPPRPARDLAPVEVLPADVLEARKAFDDGDDAAALTKVAELRERSAVDEHTWSFIQRVLIRSGSVTDYVRALLWRQRHAADARVRAHETKELGRLRELDVRWTPTLPPSDVAYEPVEGRVLHVIKESAPYLTNGYTMRSGYTVASQLAAGLDPVVVTSLGFPRKELHDVTPDDLETAEVFGVRHHRLDLGPTFPYETVPWDELLEAACVAVQPIVEEERPQLVQAGSGYRGIETALLGLAIARRYGLPFVYEVRSFLEHTWTGELDRSERGEHFALRSRREVQLMLEADHVITIADAMKDDLVARGVPADHVSIVPNGVDTASFVPRDFDPAIAAELGLPADTPIVGYVSNLGQREGLDVLIKAVLDLRRGGRDVVGLIIGEGPMRDELEAMLRDSGDPDAVLLPGRIPHDRIQEHYALFDVFVIPRLDDRAARLVTPLKPFEAMALQRAMVVSDLPALREITDPPHRGRTFRTGDAGDLARVLGELLDAPEERRRIGAASRDWVVAERDWDMNGPRYRAVYDRILGGSS